MSKDLVEAVLWLALEPNRKLVLIALGERADSRTGECWPGVREISWRTSLSKKTVIGHLYALKKAGYIAALRPRGYRRRPATTRYLAVARLITEGHSQRERFQAGGPPERPAGSSNVGNESTPSERQQPLMAVDDAIQGEDAATAGLVRLREGEESTPPDRHPAAGGLDGAAEGVDGAAEGVDGAAEGVVRLREGVAASRGTVSTEPSIRNRHIEPSDQEPSPIGARARARLDAAALWLSILHDLGQRLTRSNVDHWLRDTTGTKFEDGQLVVSTPSSLASDWLTTRLSGVIRQATERVVPGIDVRFEPRAPP